MAVIMCIGMLTVTAQSFSCIDSVPLAPCSEEGRYCALLQQLKQVDRQQTRLDLAGWLQGDCLEKNVSSVVLDVWAPQAFEQVPALQHLQLPASVAIPQQVEQLPNLTMLRQYAISDDHQMVPSTWYDARNYQQALPEGLFECVSLQSLKIYPTSIPSTIGQLTQLKNLTIVMNKVEAHQLPSSCVWAKLSQLDTVYWQVDHSPSKAVRMLYRLPALEGLTWITRLEGHAPPLSRLLKRLQRRSNRLKYLYLSTQWQPTEDQKSSDPSSTNAPVVKATLDFPQTTKLTLRYCGMTKIVVPPQGLATCRVLNLAHNYLSALPTTIGKVTTLEVLDLSYNHLTTLPKEMGQLRQLKRLSLRHNPWTSFPTELKNLQQLETVLITSDLAPALKEQLVAWFGASRVIEAAHLPSDIGPLDYLSRQ